MNETADMNVELYVNVIFINTPQESLTGCMTTGNSEHQGKKGLLEQSHMT